jgi:hypothetical protein
MAHRDVLEASAHPSLPPSRGRGRFVEPVGGAEPHRLGWPRREAEGVKLLADHVLQLRIGEFLDRLGARLDFVLLPPARAFIQK